LPLITAIIPNYNHARFLKKRIESILGQEFGDFEIIILDDSSNDSSKAIIEGYRQHPKVKSIVFNEVNTGSPFKQWAKGIALADTEWIWIAESDDYCDPFFLSSLEPAFQNEKTVLAYSEIKWVNERGEIIKDAVEEEPTWFEGREFLRKKMLFLDHLVNAGMVVFRRSCAENVTPAWQGMKQAGDYWFWCEIARQGMVYCCGKSHAFFTKHEKEVSARWLGSQVHFEEETAVLVQMMRQQAISKEDLKKRAINELASLRCTKAGMPAALFKQQYSSWQNFQLQQELNITDRVIMFNEYNRKAKHFLRRFLRWFEYG
jgi:glycosyltransferase involved in cell wall biosynthesis